MGSIGNDQNQNFDSTVKIRILDTDLFIGDKKNIIYKYNSILDKNIQTPKNQKFKHLRFLSYSMDQIDVEIKQIIF